MHFLKRTTLQLVPWICLVLGAATLVAQGTPLPDMTRFVGTWKEDLSKTVRNVANETREYGQKADGFMTLTVGTGADAHHDTFRVDGKSYPFAFSPGATQRWTHPDPTIWESSVTQGHAPPYTVRRTVSSDGATLTMETIAKDKDGKTLTRTLVYKRTSAEKSGLVGTWKLLSDYTDTPSVLIFKVDSDGALHYSDSFTSFKATPDGKLYPAADGSYNVSLKLPADRTLELTISNQAKPYEIDTLTVSPDGMIINEIDRDPNTNKQIGALVFQRQP